MRTWSLVAAALGLPLSAFAQQPPPPTIASVDSISRGATVTVRRAAQELRVTPIGHPNNPTGYRNKDLLDQDFVLTAANSTAVVLFKDQSRLDLNQTTEIQILEANLREPTSDGRTIGRRIRLLAGQIISDVKPNPAIKTDFVTPSGSAAVRGTEIGLSYDADTGVMRIHVTEGSVTVHHPWLGAQFGLTLNAGDTLEMQFNAAEGSLQIQSIMGDALEGSIGDQQVRVAPGSTVRVSVGDEGATYEVEEGDMQEYNEGTGEWEDAGETGTNDEVTDVEDPTFMEFETPELPTEMPTDVGDQAFDTGGFDLMDEVVGEHMGDTWVDLTGGETTGPVDGTIVGEQIGTELVTETHLPEPPRPPY